MIVVAETFIRESEVSPSQNLWLPVTTAVQAPQPFEAWLKHRTSSPHGLQGATRAGLTSRGASIWSSSKCVRSACKCVVERHLWVPYSSPPASPGLQEAGEGACLQKSCCRTSQGKCTLQGKKNMLRVQLAEGLWCPLCFCCCSAVPLAHTSVGVPLAGRSRGLLPPCHSSCWREGYLGPCPPCLPSPGQEVFPGAGSPAGKGSLVAQLLDRQMQYRDKRGNSTFCIFSLSQSCLCIPSAGSAGDHTS